MRIAFAADHAGYLLKDELARWLGEQGHEIIDLGTNGPESVDYPQFGERVAKAVASGEASAVEVALDKAAHGFADRMFGEAAHLADERAKPFDVLVERLDRMSAGLLLHLDCSDQP